MADDDGPEVLDLGAVDEPEPPEGGDPGSGPRGPGRRALVALGGLAVVGVGIAALRSGTATPRATPVTTSPSPAPSVSARSTPSPGRPDRVATTDLGGPLLGGPRLDVFGRGSADVLRIELATGRVTRTPAPSDAGQSFVPVRSGVLLHREDTGVTYLVPDGRLPQNVPPALTGSGPLLAGPDLDHVWVLDGTARTPRMTLVGIDGRPTRTTVPLPAVAAWQFISDGAGYPLVNALGGTYRSEVTGVVRITTGAVIAAGPSGWLVVDCDDAARCSQFLVNRNGGRQTVPGGAGADLASGLGGPVGALAPDGTKAGVLVGDPQGTLQLTVIDTARGVRTPTQLSLVPGTPSTSLAWSPDGRWLFAVDSSGRIVVVDPPSGRVRPLVPDTVVPALPVLEQLALRPG